MPKSKTPPEFDEVKFQAKSQVREALMNTPGAKREVRRTEKAIRKQMKETKRNVVKGMKKKK